MPKKSKKIPLKASGRKLDWVFILLTLGLTVFGLVMVANVSVVEAYRDFSDELYLFHLQTKWAIVGFVGFLIMSFVDYKILRKIAIPFMILALLSLLVVLIPSFGSKVMGAQRWISMGPISFQPAELAKLAFIIYLSAFFSKKKAFLPFAVLTCVLVALIMLQPDLGTAVILTVSGLIIYFVSGASIVLLAGVSLVGFASALVMILLSSYRKQRLLTFFNPDKDPLGASYHLRQILLALGSGGLFGLGLGQSRQKYNYLPAVTTDSIFAVIAEEVGFIGAAVVIMAFLFYIYKALMIAKRAPDKFGMLLAVGIASWIGVQALINLAVIVSLVPLTGTPLPFISYGGSSLVLVLVASGILVNISRQRIVRK